MHNNTRKPTQIHNEIADTCIHDHDHDHEHPFGSFTKAGEYNDA